jgi:D-alanyl-D-alanine carboxypeptidase
MPPENQQSIPTNTNNKLKFVVIVLCLLVLGGEIFLLRRDYSPIEATSNETPTNANSFSDQIKDNKKQDITLQIDPQEILARSAVVVDLQTGKVLFAKDKDKPLPLASITKIMTALVATKYADGQKIVKITTEDLLQEGDSGLKAGERWRLKDLINFTLVSSSNDGAAAIASAVTSHNTNLQFSDLMNIEAKKLGMTNTYFINATGLDLNKDYSGSYGSAIDVAKMFGYIIKSYPTIITDTAKPIATYISADKKRHVAINTNKIVAALPGLRASKTGYTDIADGNLAVVIDAGVNQPYAIVVLGSTENGRFRDVDKLVKALYQEINKKI